MMGFWDGSGISWTICKQPAPRSRQITTPAPHRSIFTGRMLFLTHNQQCQSTECTHFEKLIKLINTGCWHGCTDSTETVRANELLLTSVSNSFILSNDILSNELLLTSVSNSSLDINRCISSVGGVAQW